MRDWRGQRAGGMLQDRTGTQQASVDVPFFYFLLLLTREAVSGSCCSTSVEFNCVSLSLCIQEEGLQKVAFDFLL